MRLRLLVLALFCLAAFALLGQSFAEGFENGVPPTGWTGVGATSSTVQVHGGTYSAYYINVADYLVTPKLAVPGAMTWYTYKGGNGNARTLIETSPDGTNWTERFRGGNIGGGTWETNTYTFTVTNVFIRFSFVQGGGTALYLDDISISPASYNLYYRTKASGNWASASIWEYSTDNSVWYAATSAPTASTALTTTILSGHSVTVAASVIADQLVVNSGGSLIVSSGQTLTLNSTGTDPDLTMNGSLTITGTLANTGATMTTGSGSTITFNGTSAQTTGTGFATSVYNLVINNPNGVTSSTNLTVNTNLTMTSGALSMGANTLAYATGSTLIYNGTAAQTVGAEWPSTLTINVTNNNTSTSGITLTGSKTAFSGTFFNNETITVGGYYIGGSGTVINNDFIISTTSSPVTTTTFTQSTGSTIEYISDVTLPSPFAYQNLILNSLNTEFDLAGQIDVNETFSTQNNARLQPNGYRMFFPFKYVSIGGTSTVTAFTPETYDEAPGPSGAVARKWTFSGTASGITTIYLHWDNDQDDSLVFTGGSKIWRYTGSEWVLLATTGVPVADGASRMMVSFTITLGTKADNPGQYAVTPLDETLPIELSSFTAMISSTNYVQLTWITQSETNVAGFRIYRNTTDDLATAEMLNTFVHATNTSQMQVYVYTDEEIQQNGTYYYWLQNLDLDGSFTFHGPTTITITGHEPGIPPVPVVLGINNAYPNPFNPSLTIKYGMTKSGTAALDIYNQRGQLVRNLMSGARESGSYSQVWDGRDNSGRELPSGVYFIRLQASGKTFGHKVVLLK